MKTYQELSNQFDKLKEDIRETIKHKISLSDKSKIKLYDIILSGEGRFQVELTSINKEYEITGDIILGETAVKYKLSDIYNIYDLLAILYDIDHIDGINN